MSRGVAIGVAEPVRDTVGIGKVHRLWETRVERDRRSETAGVDRKSKGTEQMCDQKCQAENFRLTIEN